METRPRLAFDREELAVAPQALGPTLDELAGETLGDRLVVVGDLERSEAFVANPESSGGKRGLAEMAAKLPGDLRAGIDGYFVDQPEIGVRARDAFLRRP